MVKRSTVDLQAIADWHNLAVAFGRAAQASGRTRPVARFGANLEGNLAQMRRQIMEECVPVGDMTSFCIRDPKTRIIHAPCFRERVLHRKFKNPGLLRLMERIIRAYQASPGRGVPIGALTSQHFANYYLAGLDRWLLDHAGVRGLVRYMDDLLWCCADKALARESLEEAQSFISEQLRLEIKQPPCIGRCRQGTLFCGYRVLPGRLLLSRRRKRRYTERRRFWEYRFEQGRIDALGLQAGYAATLGITAHADAAAWRREQLRRRPLAKRLEEV